MFRVISVVNYFDLIIGTVGERGCTVGIQRLPKNLYLL